MGNQETEKETEEPSEIFQMILKDYREDLMKIFERIRKTQALTLEEQKHVTCFLLMDATLLFRNILGRDFFYKCLETVEEQAREIDSFKEHLRDALERVGKIF